MSDVSVGAGWWQATDGKWYAPERHPDYRPPAAPPPPPGPPEGRPKKKLTRRLLFWILLVVVIFFGGCIGIVAGISSSVKHVATEKHTVVCSVTGSGTSTADITYDTFQEGNGQKGLAQLTSAPLPWSKTITASGLFTSYNVSATNGPLGLSYVTCTLTVDGKVVSTNTSKGPYATAACSG